MFRTAISLATASLLLGEAAFAGDFTSRSGDHFRVTCHFSSEAVADAALSTVEAVWPVADELFGAKSPAPASPLEVHLYRGAADYHKAEADLTHGRFRDNLAFSDLGTKSAHVALQPDCTDAALQAIGMTAQTRRLLAHEAVHLYRYATLPNHADHPDWLADGFSEAVADEVMRQGHYSPGDEQDPFTASYIVALQVLLREGKLPKCDAVLKDRINLPANARYGLRWLFFRFMQSGTHRDAWRKVLAEARRLGGGVGYTERLHHAVAEQLGADVMSKLDGEFAEYVQSLRPEWEQVYRMLDTGREPWVQVAFGDANAIAWCTQPPAAQRYRIAGSAQILPGGREQLNILLGRCEKGFISVALKAGGGVIVFRYSAKEDRWDKLGGAEAPEIVLQRWIPFRVECVQGTLRVSVGDRQVLELSPGPDALSGPWGVGAQAGSAGLWRAVVLTTE